VKRSAITVVNEAGKQEDECSGKRSKPEKQRGVKGTCSMRSHRSQMRRFDDKVVRSVAIIVGDLVDQMGRSVLSVLDWHSRFAGPVIAAKGTPNPHLLRSQLLDVSHRRRHPPCQSHPPRQHQRHAAPCPRPHQQRAPEPSAPGTSWPAAPASSPAPQPYRPAAV